MTVVSDAIMAYPGCPPIAWLIASRVCNPYEEQDAFISFTGRKGSGKSTASSAFCEGIAEYIAMIRKKGEPPEKFFNIDHVRSISEQGAIELLSSGALKQENSVFLLDDTGTQWGARNFQSPINKHLNAILQICRVYKCVLVANFIMNNHVDLQARQMTDFRAHMLWKNTKTQQAVFKIYYIEQGLDMNGKSKEYKKFLTWHGKRLSKVVIGKPTPDFEQAYKAMRRTNTDVFIDDAQRKLKEGFAKNTTNTQDDEEPEEIVVDKYSDHPNVLAIQDEVLRIRGNPDLSQKEKTDTAIARKIGSTRYWVERVH
jgi:hypothetical protein